MFQKLRVKILILYNTLLQKKKVSNLMRLFVKTKELLPVKTIFVWVYIPQTMVLIFSIQKLFHKN